MASAVKDVKDNKGTTSGKATVPDKAGNGKPIKPTRKADLTPVKGKKDFNVRLFRHADNKPMTADKMMELLGWKSESEDNQFGDDYLFIDETKTKVRLENNDHNRPFTITWAEQLAQDILTKNFQFNGETFIFGENGNCLSGQHRGVALVLAKQKWEKNPTSEYRRIWGDDEPTIECIVIEGISEDPKVKRTLDNVKPRSLSDVLFADTSIFSKIKNAAERSKLTRYVDGAVNFLWERLLRKADAYEPRKSHAAALDFIAYHPHVLQAVQHIHNENGEKENRIGMFVSPGLAAGMLYLMGASGSEDDNYYGTVPTKEGSGKKGINWVNWDKAKQFWTEFANGKLDALTDAMTELVKDNPQGREPTRDEKVSLFIKAWNLYQDDEELTKDNLVLEYGPFEGKTVLYDYPVVMPHGIDKGTTKDPRKKMEELEAKKKAKEEREAETEAKKAEREAEKERIKKEKEAKKAEKDRLKAEKAAAKKAKKSKDEEDEDEDEEDEDEEEMEDESEEDSEEGEEELAEDEDEFLGDEDEEEDE
jgi:hypothetical protein